MIKILYMEGCMQALLEEFSWQMIEVTKSNKALTIAAKE